MGTFRVVFVLGLLISSTLASVCASEMAPILRRGHFETITDSAAGQYVIESFRMSGDGSRVVFYVRQTVRDDRECYGYQLRIIDTDGSNEMVIEQGFTYDTGVGNYCANSLYNAYAISYDGDTIAYLRLRSPEERYPEIMAYHVPSATKTSILWTLTHRAYGATTQQHLDPSGGWSVFPMTGDGSQIFFINRFGPYGPPGSSGEPGPSGFTLYRVFTNGAGADAVYSVADLATTPGVNVSTVNITAAGGFIAVDENGSVLLLPVGGSYPSANPPKHVLKINPNIGAASAEVFLDFVGLGLNGPALSMDGLTVVFARGGSADPLQNGLFARGIAADAPEVLLDSKLSWSANPALSSFGNAVVHNVDQGGGSSYALSYATTDGALLVPLTLPVTRTRYDYGAISEDGSMVVFCGAVEGAGSLMSITQFDLIRMDWASEAAPSIDSIEAEPELTLLRQTIFDSEFALNTHYYTVSGTNLAGMYAYPFNSDARLPGGTSRFHRYGGILDNGEFGGDAVAGDGIFTENDLYIAGDEAEAPLKLRVGVTSYEGTASFVDALIPLRPKVLAVANFAVDPIVGAAPLAVNFQDLSTGDYLETRWDFDDNYSIDRTGTPGEEFVHVFTNARNYNPRLVATGRGSTNELRNSVTIRVFSNLAGMARTLGQEVSAADPGGPGEVDFERASALVPALDLETYEAWDTNEDGMLSRRELIVGAGGGDALHTGDQDADLKIDLSELLRIIQFYNSGGYHCAASPIATEDGYWAGPGEALDCFPHKSDYNPQDWLIDLSELLRLIQFYNSLGYHFCPDLFTEDGFCPGIG
jgi:PKD repeat protein